jgi:hypothetical protein
MSTFPGRSGALTPDGAIMYNLSNYVGKGRRGSRAGGGADRPPQRAAPPEFGLVFALLASETPKGKASLRFQTQALEDIFPRLYPPT